MQYEVDYSAYFPEFGVLTIEADSVDLAEQAALDKLLADMPEAKDIHIEMVKEIKH